MTCMFSTASKSDKCLICNVAKRHVTQYSLLRHVITCNDSNEIFKGILCLICDVNFTVSLDH